MKEVFEDMSVYTYVGTDFVRIIWEKRCVTSSPILFKTLLEHKCDQDLSGRLGTKLFLLAFLCQKV